MKRKLHLITGLKKTDSNIGIRGASPSCTLYVTKPCRCVKKLKNDLPDSFSFSYLKASTPLSKVNIDGKEYEIYLHPRGGISYVFEDKAFEMRWVNLYAENLCKGNGPDRPTLATILRSFPHSQYIFTLPASYYDKDILIIDQAGEKTTKNISVKKTEEGDSLNSGPNIILNDNLGAETTTTPATPTTNTKKYWIWAFGTAAAGIGGTIIYKLSK